MFKRLGTDAYLCDSKDDLATLPERDMGAEAYVIENSSTYRLTSKGEWVRQGAAANGVGAEVDLTGYATEDYVNNKSDEILTDSKKYTDDKIGKIKIPSTSNFAKKEDLQNYATDVELELVKSNPIFKMFNPSLGGGGQYALYLTAAENKTLADAMKEQQLGMYTFWMQKGHTDLPASMNAANLSGRGFCCVDYYDNDENYIGWAVMFNKNNEVFYRFINHAVTGPWMKITAAAE